MATHEVAQRTPYLFPELPVGSPERSAVFAGLRKTFVEDWRQAEADAAEAVRMAMGDLYFVQVGNHIKIGRTTNFDSRMKMIACHAPTPPKLLARVRGAGGMEALFHRKFKHLRTNGEWFECRPEIEAEIARLTSLHRVVLAPSRENSIV